MSDDAIAALHTLGCTPVLTGCSVITIFFICGTYECRKQVDLGGQELAWMPLCSKCGAAALHMQRVDACCCLYGILHCPTGRDVVLACDHCGARFAMAPAVRARAVADALRLQGQLAPRASASGAPSPVRAVRAVAEAADDDGAVVVVAPGSSAAAKAAREARAAPRGILAATSKRAAALPPKDAREEDPPPPPPPESDSEE
jgi:hypothetical protein